MFTHYQVRLSDSVCFFITLPKNKELQAKEEQIRLPQTITCSEQLTTPTE